MEDITVTNTDNVYTSEHSQELDFYAHEIYMSPLHKLDLCATESFTVFLKIKGILHGPFASKSHDVTKHMITFHFVNRTNIITDAQFTYIFTDNDGQVINCDIFTIFMVMSSVRALDCTGYLYRYNGMSRLRYVS